MRFALQRVIWVSNIAARQTYVALKESALVTFDDLAQKCSQKGIFLGDRTFFVLGNRVPSTSSWEAPQHYAKPYRIKSMPLVYMSGASVLPI